MTIRELTLSDAAALAEIECLCFSQPWSEAAVAESMGVGDVFLGAFEEKLIGFVGMRAFDDSGEIGNVAVHPDHRRRGIAKALLSALHNYATNSGVAEIVLQVRQSNESAKALYEACGYSVCGVRKNLYERPREDGIVMKTEIKNENTCH